MSQAQKDQADQQLREVGAWIEAYLRKGKAPDAGTSTPASEHDSQAERDIHNYWTEGDAE
jgi:hypothetical protein